MLYIRQEWRRLPAHQLTNMSPQMFCRLRVPGGGESTALAAENLSPSPQRRPPLPLFFQCDAQSMPLPRREPYPKLRKIDCEAGAIEDTSSGEVFRQ